eukprot:7128523-Prymnesium_polylepis.1
MDHVSLKCDLSDDEYSLVVLTAYVFVALWPIGVPFLFLVALFVCRNAIAEARMTRFVRSTSFLHREYTKEFYCWEVLFLTQRMLVIGCACAVGDVKGKSDPRIEQHSHNPLTLRPQVRAVDPAHKTLRASVVWASGFIQLPCATVSDEAVQTQRRQFGFPGDAIGDSSHLLHGPLYSAVHVAASSRSGVGQPYHGVRLDGQHGGHGDRHQPGFLHHVHCFHRVSRDNWASHAGRAHEQKQSSPGVRSVLAAAVPWIF